MPSEFPSPTHRPRRVVSTAWDRIDDPAGAPRAPSGFTFGETTAPPPRRRDQDLKPYTDRVYAYLTSKYNHVMVDPTKTSPEVIADAVSTAVTLLNLSQGQAERIHDIVMAQLTGARDIEEHMSNPAVSEIMVVNMNVYVEQNGLIHRSFPLASDAEAIQLATHLCKRCGVDYQQTRSTYDLTWPTNGARINIVHHSISPTGVSITIRKRNTVNRMTMQDLQRMGMLTEEVAKFLVLCVRGRLNVLITGATGTGKTTVLRALASEGIDPRERVGVLEDTEELRLPLEHMIVLVAPAEVDEAAHDKGMLALHDLFVNTLRMRFDRILMGELRSIEAFDFIEAGLTDRGGMLSTFHIRRPDLLSTRLYWIAQKNKLPIPYDLVRTSVFQSIDLIVQIDRDGDGRRYISSVVETNPDGTVTPLYQWDPDQQHLVKTQELSAPRQRWINEYRPG